MPQLHLPWLELSVLIPLLGAVPVARLKDALAARRVCFVVCTLTLACATCEWIDFSTLATFEAHDHWDLLQHFTGYDLFVVDELSAPLLPLAALLYLTTVMITLKTKLSRFSFAGTLFSESILLATLACREPWVIIGLLALATVPPWLELRRRKQSTRIFTLHMGMAILLLALGQFLLPAEAGAANRPIIASSLLAVGALLRSGVCPLHCWLTDLFERATLGTALLFVTPMTGAYAVMRLVLPIAPTWALQMIAVLSLVTAVYAAAMALVQHDARRLFCYLFLSHSSLVLVGLEIATPIGLTGGLCVWLSVGLSLLGFGLVLRSAEARLGRLSLDKFQGLYEHTPVLAGTFLLTGLSSVGFPGTVGFVGAELLIEGAVAVYPWGGLAVVVAAAMNGIAVVHAYLRVFAGARRPASISLACRTSERVVIVLLSFFILAGGVHPQPGVASRYHAASSLLRMRTRGNKLAPEGRSAEARTVANPSQALHGIQVTGP